MLVSKQSSTAKSRLETVISPACNGFPHEEATTISNKPLDPPVPWRYFLHWCIPMSRTLTRMYLNHRAVAFLQISAPTIKPHTQGSTQSSTRRFCKTATLLQKMSKEISALSVKRETSL